MKYSTDLKILDERFKSLPEPVKDWLWSEQVGYIITEITDRLGLPVEKLSIIPKLIYRLVVQDLEPINFINELSQELEVDFEIAKTIAKDIENNALKPIENDLRKAVGIDLKIIYFGKSNIKLEKNKNFEETKDPKPPKLQQTPLTEVKPLPTMPTSEKEKVESLPPFPEPIKPASLSVSPQPKKIDVPFILHNEKTTYPTPSAEELSKRKPRLELELKQFLGEKSGPKQVAVKLETPQDKLNQSPPITQPTPPPPEIKQPTEKSNSRVVHYHGLKTSIDKLGLPKKEIGNERIIDLRNLQ